MPMMKRPMNGAQAMPNPHESLVAPEPDGGTGGGDELMEMLLRAGIGGLGGGMSGGMQGALGAVLQQILMSKLGPAAGGGMTKRVPETPGA